MGTGTDKRRKAGHQEVFPGESRVRSSRGRGEAAHLGVPYAVNLQSVARPGAVNFAVSLDVQGGNEWSCHMPPVCVRGGAA